MFVNPSPHAHELPSRAIAASASASAAARGAINSLMGELREDHIRNYMPRKTKSAEEAADDLIEIVRTYLK